MNVPRRYFTLLSLWFCSLTCTYCQDIITFTPVRAPCVGDRIEMVCSLQPPPSEMFGTTVASVSINGSTPITLTQLNSNAMVEGIDLSRYSANVDGLTPSTAMPVIRLIINSYLPLDSDTTFLCATTFINGTQYDSTVSGSPVTPAGPISLSDTNTRITFQIQDNLIISVNATPLSQFERNDTLFYTYTLEYDTSSESSDATMNNTYTFVNVFTCDVCYRVSYSAENCAGGSGTVSSGYFGLQRVHNTTGNFERSPSDPKLIEWKYKELPCGNTEENFLPEEYFTFSLINRLTGDSSNVANSSLNLPYGFSVDIPQNIDITINDYDLAITFIDLCYNVVIPIEITGGEDNTLTIILGVFFGLLLILLCVLVTITVVFLVIWCMKRSPDKK